jgi:hypothetical protein
MAPGPTKKKMVDAAKMRKKMRTPIENSPRRQAPLLSSLARFFTDPARPATPSNRKRIVVR